MIYDSSGLQIYDGMGSELDVIIRGQAINISDDSNSEDSVGRNIETA